MTEDINDDERTNLVKRTSVGEISLITRSFGRGTDFVCYDKAVNENGGVLVIQTFFSQEPTEEIQIKGRTLRQGKKGSYRLFLSRDDVIGEFGLNPDEFNKNCVDSHDECYNYLTEVRNKLYDKKRDGKEAEVDKIKDEHDKSVQFLRDIIATNIDGVFNYITEENKFIQVNIVSTQTTKPTHIVMALDSSGSMASNGAAPWHALVEAVRFYINSRLEKGGVSDLVSVIIYDHEVKRVVQEPITNLKVDDQNVLQLFGGGTEFGIAINKSYELFDKTDKDKYNMAFLFLSDGASSSGDKEIERIGQTFGPLGLKTFTLAFGKYADQDKLKTMATLHGYDAKFLAADISSAASANVPMQQIAEAVSNPVLYQLKTEM